MVLLIGIAYLTKLEFTNRIDSPGKRPKGRPQHMLPTRLNKDLKSFKMKFQNVKDLTKLRKVAQDREKRRSITKSIKK